MNIENTEDFLNKFDYKFERKNQTITVIMDYRHQVFIDFKNPDKIVISDQLVTGNFITGMLKMSIKKAILLNVFCNILLSSVIALFDLKFGIGLFITLGVWTIYWSIKHISKYEKLRYILTNWGQRAVYSIES
ncbi:hypothetical protein Q4566_07045 [Tamlana sp. 2_MG-2023]|uniref:hypothetical protein n=1 Tax=unclassified Tamlana TaxID=2614803 RepID=UPI0026E2652E|nr:MULTISPECIES: hypothetical protein [unclassified Tamlana]MDO6759953.1 hypothetical protein [Tamlana sp. 2_MG-2023]MDO6791877.1 hypothetical protein [Tamlana sp. 1_MG-2023]